MMEVTTRMAPNLTPSSLPNNAPEELIEMRVTSLVAIKEWKEATQVARKALHNARQSLDRYEAALLEHRGQLRLFGGEDG